MLGYYSPSSDVNALYHSQTGDLHTPGMGIGMGLGTPLSMRTGEVAAHSEHAVYFAPCSQAMPHSFQNYNVFAHPATQEPQQQQSYAPATFMNHDTGYEPMDHDGSPVKRGRYSQPTYCYPSP